MSVCGNGTELSPGIPLFALNNGGAGGGGEISSPLSVLPSASVPGVAYIRPGVGAGGRLVLGSSDSQTTTCILFEDISGNGVFAVAGAVPNGTSLFFTGSNNDDATCYIRPGASFAHPGTETLAIGSSSEYPEQIVINQGAITLSTGLEYPASACPALTTAVGSQVLGTVGGSQSIALTNPSSPGLYAITVGTTLGTDGYSRQGQLSVIGYYNGTQWSSGGSGSVRNGTTQLAVQGGGVIGAYVIADGYTQITPSTDRTTLVYTNGSGANIYPIVNMTKIYSTLTGFTPS